MSDEVIGEMRTCDGCATVRPVQAVVGDAYLCAPCVVDSVREIHAPREILNEHTAPYSVSFCVEDRQAWPCATARAVGITR